MGDNDMTGPAEKSIVYQILMFLVCLAFVGMFLSALVQVAGRYVLDRPLVWTEELARSLYIWLTFVGTGALIRTHDHIRVDYVLRKLPKRWRNRLELFIDILAIVVFVYLVVSALTMVERTAGVTLPTLPITMAYLYVALVVGGIIACCYLVERIVRNAISASKGGE